MNRQNNLKIIITTVIVLVISAIAVFTVVNWAEIVKKFQGAASKSDGIEKHERNTVPPSSNTNTTVTNTPTEEWKDIPASKDESKLTQNNLTDTKNTAKFEDNAKTNAKLKEADPYGIDDPPTLKPKDKEIGTFAKFKDNDEYPMGNEGEVEKKVNPTSEKTVRMSKGKKHHHHRKYRGRRGKFTKVKNLDRRVTFLEKKLGIKKTVKGKKPSLENRIYRLEKLITKKKK
jgi:hypothetical protein